MKGNEFREIMELLEVDFEVRKKKVIEKYISKNARFKVGDIIGNVTGYIKVDSIGYELESLNDLPIIVYSGLKYWKYYRGTEYIRTQDNTIRSISDIGQTLVKVE